MPLNIEDYAIIGDCETALRADSIPRPFYQMQHLLKERNNGGTDFGS
jgi:hypothetical protein